MDTLQLIIDYRHPAYSYYCIRGLSYKDGQRLKQDGWQWARKFDGVQGCWFHTDETIALPAFERLGLKPTVLYPSETEVDKGREGYRRVFRAHYGDDPICD